MLFGDSEKVPRGVLPRVPGKLGVPQGVLPRVLSLLKNEGKHSREHSLGHSQFPGHSREHSLRHFLGVPKKHSESTRRSTFGESLESTPVNGGRDLKASSQALEVYRNRSDNGIIECFKGRH